MVFTPVAAGLLRSKIVVLCEGRLVSTLSRSSCFGRLAVSFHFAAAASAFIALTDWNSLDGGRVAFGQLRAIARRTHHTRMQHSGQSHVMHVGRAAGDFGGDIDA